MLRIFLVKDSEVIRDHLAATLQETTPAIVVGYAEDELNAVEWVRANPASWDLVIVDIFLRSGSGLGVLSATRNCQAPRIVVSNYATLELHRRCIELGAQRVFDKSNDIEALTDYCNGLDRDMAKH